MYLPELVDGRAYLKCLYCTGQFKFKLGKKYCSTKCQRNRHHQLRKQRVKTKRVYAETRQHPVAGIARYILPGDSLGPGVYFLMDGGTTLYVGASKVLLRRIGEHIRDRKINFTRIELEFHKNINDARKAERYYILVYQPPHNLMSTLKYIPIHKKNLQ